MDDDFPDIERYCLVCDRLITAVPAEAVAPSAAICPTPFASTSSAAPPPPEPSTSAASKASTSTRHGGGEAGAPKMRRTASGASAGSGHGGHASARGALKRNKSSGKLHGAGGRRVHGHGLGAGLAGLGALAPLAPAAGGAATAEGKGKKAVRRGSKAWEEVIEVIESDPPPEEGVPSATPLDPLSSAGPSGMYCSEECRLIDETRNALQLAHLAGRPPAVTSPELAPSLFPQALSRRRSSGLSSLSSGSGSTATGGSHGLSSVGVLSPILSAQPTTNNPASSSFHDADAYPFPALSSPQPPPLSSRSPHRFNPPPPSRSASAVSSLPPYVAPPPLVHASASLPLPAHPLPSHPPLLNFGARRQSRGAESSGASYPYRPSLVERGQSSDALHILAARGGDAKSGPLGQEGRSSSARERFGSSLSVQGLARMERARSEVALAGMEREGRGSSARPPSALSAVRSMTPVSHLSPASGSDPSTSPVRPRTLLSHSSSSLSGTRRPPSEELSSPVRGVAVEGEERGRSSIEEDARDRRRKKKETRFFVGSAPSGPAPIVGRPRGPSFGEPSVADASSLHPAVSSSVTSRGLALSSHPRRTASSASLALLGTSLGKSPSIGPAPSWGGPKRSESVASLSAFMALGEIASPSLSGTPVLPSDGDLPPVVSSSAASTVIPASSSFRLPPPRTSSAHSPTSTASASSYGAYSHSSYGGGLASNASRSSTDLSSHPAYPHSHASSSLSHQSHSHHPHPPAYNPILSTSANSARSAPFAGSGLRRSSSSSSRSRANKSLFMTPSASASHLPSLAGTGPTLVAPSASSGAALFPPSSSGTAPANAASTNPSLAYLRDSSTSGDVPPPSHVPSPAPSAPPILQGPVEPPKYPVYDLDTYRAAPAFSASGDRGRGSDVQEKEGAMLPPPVPTAPRGRRKQLFYFPDQKLGGT
ncbi:hypothetical protein JCM11251_006723 [Rhodosporidiobolus azoricus]